jgi:hypothetical protein
MASSPLLALALLSLLLFAACGGASAQLLGRRGLLNPFIGGGGGFSSASAVAVASAGTGGLGYGGYGGVYPGVGLYRGANAALLVQCAGPAGPLIPECIIFFGR